MRPMQSGTALLSLMLAISLAVGILLSALRLVVQANADFVIADQSVLLADQAGHALEVIERTLQQAGRIDGSRPMQLPARPSTGAIHGFDNARLPGTRQAIGMPITGAHLGSDVLIVQFAGDAGRHVVNCAGLPVRPASGNGDDAGWSAFYVDLDPLGEPELRCRYRGGADWLSQPIASGVESLQVLYGVDSDDDGLPNDFVSASWLNAATAAAGQPAAWTRVVALHVSLLMRSPQSLAGFAQKKAIDLFGPRYAGLHAGDDAGTSIAPARLAPRRLHRQFDALIFLNNSLRPPA